jgi:uncharacterized protein YjbJ (UPF0337 family)
VFFFLLGNARDAEVVLGSFIEHQAWSGGGREAMNWDHVARMWKRAKGKIQEKWDKLTDDDLKFVDGRRDRLEDRIQHRYGFSPDHVRKEVDDWVRWQAPVSPQRRSRTARSSLGLATITVATLQQRS